VEIVFSTETSFPLSARWLPVERTPIASDYPLVVALHGGIYASGYFEVDGHSMLEKAVTLGMPILAIEAWIDQPSHPALPSFSRSDRS
jgi:hypothetical protein